MPKKKVRQMICNEDLLSSWHMNQQGLQSSVFGPEGTSTTFWAMLVFQTIYISTGDSFWSGRYTYSMLGS